VAVVVNRDNRVIVAVVEVFRGRRLVVVAVAVIDAHETTSFCRIAHPRVPRQCRIGAEGACEGRHATRYFGSDDLVRRDAVLNPLHERRPRVEVVRPCTATAVPHPWRKE